MSLSERLSNLTRCSKEEHPRQKVRASLTPRRTSLMEQFQVLRAIKGR